MVKVRIVEMEGEAQELVELVRPRPAFTEAEPALLPSEARPPDADGDEPSQDPKVNTRMHCPDCQAYKSTLKHRAHKRLGRVPEEGEY